MPVPSTVLASAARSAEQLPADILPWLLVLVAVIIVGGVIIYLVRRSLYSNTSSSSAGFTLHDLRTLHAAGELSEEEFQRAKAQMIGRLAAGPKQSDSNPATGSPAPSSAQTIDLPAETSANASPETDQKRDPPFSPLNDESQAHNREDSAG